MHTRFGPLGLTLLFSFAIVAAPIGIDTDTLTIKESAAYAAKGGNKGGNSASHRSSKSGGGGSTSSASSSSSGGGNDTSTSRRGHRSSNTSVASNVGSNKKVFTNADGTERAHPSVLGRLNAWLNADENALQNASLNSTMGLARVYQEQRSEANSITSDAEAACLTSAPLGRIEVIA